MNAKWCDEDKECSINLYICYDSVIKMSISGTPMPEAAKSLAL